MTASLLLYGSAMLAGFYLLSWAADRFVGAASAAAYHLGVSALVVGLTIVGFGTSAPEMLVSAVAAWEGTGGMAVGNAIGSNIANIGLILGFSAFIVPLKLHSMILRRELPALFLVMLLTLMLLLDGALGRVDGAILLLSLAILVLLLVLLARKQRTDPIRREVDRELTQIMRPAHTLLWLPLSLILMLAASRLLVWSGVEIARLFGIGEVVIGLSLMAFGTSLPELAVALAAARKKEHDLLMGNVLGSNMFNLLAVLAMPALMDPGEIAPEILWRDFPVMVVLTLVILAAAHGFGRGSQISRAVGGMLLLGYGVYLATLYVRW